LSLLANITTKPRHHLPKAKEAEDEKEEEEESFLQ
jgi:hypothetical protein